MGEQGNAAARYRVNGHYVYREIAGEGVLVPAGDLPGNVMVTLNETGAFLWRALQEPQTMESLIERARAAYDDPQGELDAQIRAFVEESIQTGHIVEVD